MQSLHPMLASITDQFLSFRRSRSKKTWYPCQLPTTEIVYADHS